MLKGTGIEVSTDYDVLTNGEIALRARAAHDSRSATQAILRTPNGVYGAATTTLELQKHREDLWRFVPPSVSKQPAALFITGTPNQIEAVRGKPLAGQDGATFKSVYLERMGLTAKDVTVAHANPSTATEAASSTPYAWRLWLERIIEDHPDVPIIALGKSASAALGTTEHITMPHPRAVRIKGDRGEIGRKAKRVRKAIDAAAAHRRNLPTEPIGTDEPIVASGHTCPLRINTSSQVGSLAMDIAKQPKRRWSKATSPQPISN